MRNLNHKKINIPQMERKIRGAVRQHGSGVLHRRGGSLMDTVNNFSKTAVDTMEDPKMKMAMIAAPYLLQALKFGYRKLNDKVIGPASSEKFVPSLSDINEKPIHAPGGYNYLGPASNAVERIKRGVEPINGTDKRAQTHDIEYGKIGDAYKAGKITREQAIQLTRISDQKLKKGFSDVREQPSTKLSEKVINVGAHGAIAGKNLLEDAGILDPMKFTLGEGLHKKPTHKLIKNAIKLTGQGKTKKKRNLKQKLAKYGAQILANELKGGNLKGVFDDIGTFFNKTIPDTFTKTIPRPFIQGYNTTKDGVLNAYDKTLGFY